MSKYSKEELKAMAQQVLDAGEHDPRFRVMLAMLSAITGLTYSEVKMKITELSLYGETQ